MVWALREFPACRTHGGRHGGVLDSARFRHFSPTNQGSVEDVTPSSSAATATRWCRSSNIDRRRHPVPIDQMGWSTQEKVDPSFKRTRGWRRRDRRLARQRQRLYAPRPAPSRWPKAFEGPRNGFSPPRLTHGQYGIDNLYVGVPVVIGAGGVEKIVEIELDAEAQKNFTVSVDAVKELLVACKAIDGSLAT